MRKRKNQADANRQLADEAARAASDVGSIAELALNTGEMRTVLARLHETEETLNALAKRLLK